MSPPLALGSIQGPWTGSVWGSSPSPVPTWKRGGGKPGGPLLDLAVSPAGEGRVCPAICPTGSVTPATCGCCVSTLSSFVLASFVEGGGPSFL